jgi:hypothetical protein
VDGFPEQIEEGQIVAGLGKDLTDICENGRQAFFYADDRIVLKLEPRKSRDTVDPLVKRLAVERPRNGDRLARAVKLVTALVVDVSAKPATPLESRAWTTLERWISPPFKLSKSQRRSVKGPLSDVMNKRFAAKYVMI